MAKTTTNILIKGKFYKPDGTRLPVGEAMQLTADQVKAFGGYFMSAEEVKAKAEVAAKVLEAAQAAAEKASTSIAKADGKKADDAATKPADKPVTKPADATTKPAS